MASLYHDRMPIPPPRMPPAGRREAAVVIVGGGFAGLNTALGLAARGQRDVVLLESRTIGFGASGRNGGFVFAGYSLGEKALLDKAGEAKAARLYRRTVEAVDLIRERIRSLAIDCDCVDAGVVWANWFRDARVLRDRQRLLAEHYGADWEWLPADALQAFVRSRRYHDGLYERNAMHIDPLAYARGLARVADAAGVSIHEQSRVRMLERRGPRWVVRVGDAEIETPQVVLACGGYLAGLDHRIDRAVLPIATYVMVTEPLGDRLGDCLRTRAAIYDTRFAFDYYRPLADTRLLWGGRISIRDRSPRAVQALLSKDLARVFPALKGVRVAKAWSGLMSYARHEMPQVGTHGNGLWYAQAFGGHGLAPTCAAGEALAEAIVSDASAIGDYADFGLAPVHRPLGYLAAQGTYWKHQLADWMTSRMEG
ncbi:NAD(P)/FAD-dependent oxidoreductase [Luteibacter sahnii]|uniref:NAD(P)/FAD-dependent oxidoreductase n=1 Tax=Luteibacter sahnii TaxID=3021977 RepID=UPI002A74C127|nr:FAD-binding oxidoreductase [Luteibacter sp. PPL193]MDY1550208.1 FAD-binding oxidoreductase [Luteibacter sp. PPL193]